MKRPRQHEIDELARRQFRSALPPSWVCRRMPEDYGVDYEVEVFHDGRSTGHLFKVQLKGRGAAEFSSDGRWAAITMPVDTLEYLCEELRIPTVVVVADLATGMSYWATPMLDQELRSRLREARENHQQQLTLRVPTDNRLSDGTQALTDALLDMEQQIASRVLRTAPAPARVARPWSEWDAMILPKPQLRPFDNGTYVETIGALLKSRYRPLGIKELLQLRIRALSLDSSETRATQLRELGTNFQTADIAAHFGDRVKVVSGAADLLQKLLQDRQTYPWERGDFLVPAALYHALSAEEFTVPLETNSFEVQQDGIAREIWCCLVGNETLEVYRAALGASRLRTVFTVWLSTNWLIYGGYGGFSSKELALIRPWQLSSISSGSEIDAMYPIWTMEPSSLPATRVVGKRLDFQ